ncbi:MAG: CvpA family protein [Candidatus Protistobacter heckmanni]|nr:CvpA family protein [Candidatus Protistobacter heckmanni]
MEFTVIDYGFGAILLISALLGALRGLVREFFGLIAWIAAAWVASHYAGDVIQYLPKAVFGQLPGGDKLALVTGFVALFIVIVLAVSLVGALLSRLLKGVGPSPADRSLGLAFGLLRGILLVLIMAYALDMTGMVKNPVWRDAVSRPLAGAALKMAEPWMPKFAPEREKRHGKPAG